MDGVVDGEGDVTCQSCPHPQDVRWKGPSYGVPSGALTPARLSEPSLELVSRSTFTQLPAQKLCPLLGSFQVSFGPIVLGPARLIIALGPR
jgi:hypothetical protein